MIDIQGLSLQRGKKILLDRADLRIFPGQHWGLIGPNGSGKSSLFALIQGGLQEDSGHCHLPKDWQIASMAQEVEDVEGYALDYVLDGDRDLRATEAAITSCSDNHRLAQLYEKMELIEGYSAGARAEQLLAGLGFSHGDGQREVREFSGGWRIRLNLARALMCRSDLLLLDEPTNHLDLDACYWLENWLKHYEGTLVMVSHDRDFLDAVVDHVASLESQKLVSYTGNYSDFERQRAARLAQQTAMAEKQAAEIAHMEDFVRRFRAKASKAKQAQSRIKALEKMERIAPAHVDSPFHFRFPNPEQASDVLLRIEDSDIGYSPVSPIIKNVHFDVLKEARIGLLGRNGAGKSTLMKSLAGALRPLSGTRMESDTLRIGYFAQHQLEALDLEASAALHIQRLDNGASEQKIRDFLGAFDFRGDRAFEPIHHFSGGEKARLALAILAWQKPQLLLLDEPTNHLDLEMCHALSVALQDFEGAVIVVSHDRHLLRNSVDQFLLVEDGRCQVFDGTLDDYFSRRLTSTTSGGEQVLETLEPSKANDKKEKRQRTAAKRKALSPLAKKISAIEKAIAKDQQKLNDVEASLADGSLYQGPKDVLEAALVEQGKLQQALEEKELEWLSLSEEYETKLNEN